ncbi:MAG: hypothetical protein K2X87_16310 [Gemmataceae bacterium]|nr:hypothetical protein [Gemmataceae bacterium]
MPSIWCRAHRPARRFAAAAGLLLGVGLSAVGQPPTESFDEKLRKAAEAQAGKSQAEDGELKRLLAESKARREAGEKQAEADLRQAETAFEQKREQLRREGAEARKELEARLGADSKALSAALADLRTRMAVREAPSEADFKRQREAFSKKLSDAVADELAKAEAERERKKQLAVAAAMTYFTGGAALPAMAAAGAGAAATPAKSASPAKPAPVPAKGHVRPVSAAPRPATSGVVPKGGKPFDLEAYRRSLEADEKGIEPDWLDPLGWAFAEAFQAARGAGGLLFGRTAKPPAVPAAGRVGGTAAEVAPAPRAVADKFRHIFGNPDHALNDLVAKFGSEEKAFAAVQRAANRALAEGKLVPYPSGVLPGREAAPVLDVGGLPVRLIGGKVQDGAVKIGTFSRKGLK